MPSVGTISARVAASLALVHSAAAQADGWYLSGDDADCNGACSAVGMKCTEDQMHAHNDEIDSKEEVVGLLEMLTGESKSSCAALGATNIGVSPVLKTGDCALAWSESGRPLSTFDCAATKPPPDNAEEHRVRLCYCWFADATTEETTKEATTEEPVVTTEKATTEKATTEKATTEKATTAAPTTQEVTTQAATTVPETTAGTTAEVTTEETTAEETTEAATQAKSTSPAPTLLPVESMPGDVGAAERMGREAALLGTLENDAEEYHSPLAVPKIVGNRWLVGLSVVGSAAAATTAMVVFSLRRRFAHQAVSRGEALNAEE